MGETSRSDDSVPSLSSYPPAFVTLITTFIQRAEEAETRAHKALIILRAKDEHVLRLQKRMEVLEKIAARLEEVMVPPLDLPPSPQTSGDLDGVHPRDTIPPQPVLESLYERYPTACQQVQQNNASGQEVHNCFTRCQHLIDGLERSNSQLREALLDGSEQRVKDHEQYVTTLAGVTQAVKEWQRQANQGQLQAEEFHSIPKLILEEITSVLEASGNVQDEVHCKENMNQCCSISANKTALLLNEDLKKKVDMAEQIIKSLQNRFKKEGNKAVRRVKYMKSKRLVKSSSASGSYHTPPSSLCIRPTIKNRTLHHSITSLKKKNKQLRLKYQQITEKLKESYNHSEKVCKKLTFMRESLRRDQKDIKKVEVFTQTSVLSPRSGNELGEKRNHLVQGRLAAAAKVMSTQHKQLIDLQNQLTASQGLCDSLRKRLSRAEGALAGQAVISESARRQFQETLDRNSILSKEVQQLKESVNRLTRQLAAQVEINRKIENQKNECESKLEETIKMDSQLDSLQCVSAFNPLLPSVPVGFTAIRYCLLFQLDSLQSTLHKRDEMSELAQNDLEAKLVGLKEQFVTQLTEARGRLEAADTKIQQLYLGIETFLKLLFGLRIRSSSTILSPTSQAQALQVASDILQLQPAQIQTILHASRDENHQINSWLRHCSQLVHREEFANSLGHFLLETVLEARISSEFQATFGIVAPSQQGLGGS